MKFHKEWEGFNNQCISPLAGHEQRSQLQKTFYAGALALMYLITYLPEDEDEADQHVAKIQAELLAYRDQVISAEKAIH